MRVEKAAIYATVGAAGVAIALRLWSRQKTDDDGLPKSVCPGLGLIGAAPDQSELVEVKTSKGPVLGFKRSSGASGGTAVNFRGVPFAAVPVGANRWRPPQPRAPWTSPLLCTEYGAACREPTAEIQGLMKNYGKRCSAAEASGPVGDDCLNLNIVTPGLAGASKPVMVWLHGGMNCLSSNHGNSLGWSPTCSEHFANAGVVMVALNYRQNMHGFAHFRSLGITNLALRDMIAALEWVRDEIGAFGGDASNVTIFGESAGGIGVATLLACPAASSLFHKAIVQSAAISSLSLDETYASLVAPDFANAFAKGAKVGGVLSREALDGLSGDQVDAAHNALSNSLLKTHHILCSPPAYHHVHGDDLLPLEPHAALAAGSARGKAVMVISTASEADVLVMGVGARIASWLAPFICRFALRGVGLNGFTPTAEAALPPDALKKAVQSLLAGFDAIGAQRVRAGAGPQQPGWLVCAEAPNLE